MNALVNAFRKMFPRESRGDTDGIDVGAVEGAWDYSGATVVPLSSGMPFSSVTLYPRMVETVASESRVPMNLRLTPTERSAAVAKGNRTRALRAALKASVEGA